MNGLRTRLALLASMAVAAAAGAGAGTRFEAQTRPVDRWLVAAAAAPDSLSADRRLSTDLLAAPGEQGVLPDRGRTAGGVTWRLLRRDGEASTLLDSLLPEAGPGAVAYAHAYVRLPSDRTLEIDWGGIGCTEARAWLNGRALEGSPVSARFGGGWNTLLVKLVAGDCPLGLHASLADAGVPDGRDGKRPAWPVGDIRVQASRPPGEVRTGPDDWVVAADTARIADVPRWRGDRLYAGLVIGLTSWGRAAVADVALELRNGPDGKATAPWLIPGTPGEAVIPVRLDELDRLLATRRVNVRLHWNDDEVERAVHVSGTPPRVDGDVQLAGWEVKRTAGQAERSREAGRLPNGAGWILQGAWKVPKTLSGRKLAILAASAPATYTVNGRPGGVQAGAVTLCDPCAQGETLRLTATSTGAWTSWPTVRGPGTASTGGGTAATSDTTSPCEPPTVVGFLPDALIEASGIARDPRDSALFWVHNDSRNSPAVFAVDGEHREIIVVTKGREGVVDLYVAPLDGLSGDSGRPDTLRRIGRLRIPTGGGTSQLVTAADLSPDGTRLVIRNYTTLYEFAWDGSAAFDTLATPRHTSLLAALEPQSEGVAWNDEGNALLLVSEGRGGRPPSLSRMRCPAT